MTANHGIRRDVGRSADEDQTGSRLRKSQVGGKVVVMTTIEDRVRELIDHRGLSHGDFARAVGLDASKLSKSLSGVRRFSSLDLARIADLTGESVDWLLTGERSAMAVAARAAQGSATQDAVEAAEDLVTMRDGLAELGYAQKWTLPTMPPLGSNWKAAGRAMADAATKWLTDRGASVVGAELPELIETHFGVDVAVTELGVDFDGLAASSEDARLILLSPTGSPFRQRFTAAHELGHLLAADDQAVHLDVDVHRVARTESEVRASTFASAFLMPEALVREALAGQVTREAFCDLAIRLRVSPSALGIRLSDLRLIDGMTKTTWSGISARQAAEICGRSDELARAAETAMTPRAPGLLRKDSFAAYQAGKTTLRPFAQLIGADVDRLRAELEATES